MSKVRMVPGFQDKYEMDLSGNVYSRERIVRRKNGSLGLRKRKLLKNQFNQYGVEYVQLYDGGKRVGRTILELKKLTFKIDIG